MRLLVLIVVALCVSAISAYSGLNGFACTKQDFEDFKVQYNKVYKDSNEDEQRFDIFCKNALKAHHLNLNAARASDVQFGITKFSDLTKEEFSRFLGYKQSEQRNNVADGAKRIKKGFTAPEEFDWRTKSPSVVTPVYNQGQCGSCWAFSATENMESQWAIAGNDLVELSVQQIVDCDKTDDGCGGGDTPTAYEYIIKAGGLDSKKAYPYTGVDGRCEFNSAGVQAKIKSWEYAGKNNETAMVDYLAQNGPVSICVDAKNWDSYRSGIYPASNCGTSLDHCVLAVGYNLPKNYWIVRNSWAADWGIDGYIYLEYGHNTCGLATEPTNSLVN